MMTTNRICHRAGRTIGLATAAIALTVAAAPTANALTLLEAIEFAVNTNPEIGEARSNREAIDFELEQARGLYLPQIDFEGSVGPGYQDSNPDGPNDEEVMLRGEVILTLQQRVFDGFETSSEIDLQASRIDGAAYRVLERSEFVALDVVQSYLDTLRQEVLQRLAIENVVAHQRTLDDVSQRVNTGRSSTADLQQAEERLRAAEATLVDIERGLAESRISFQRVVGLPAENFSPPARVGSAVPGDVEDAVSVALGNNPTLLFAAADIDATYALYEQSKAPFYPSLDIESTVSFTTDQDGQEEEEFDAEALLVMRYNLFRGGIDTANREEQVRRIDEARQALMRFERDVEQLVRETYIARDSLTQRLEILRQQVAASEQVLSSYQQQFEIGERTLLDVLDAVNELFQGRVAVQTAEVDLAFNEYRALAATGTLLPTLGIAPPAQAAATARQEVGVEPTAASETMPRRYP